ncbi:LOW QUALITY PROTEIN: hypothetical protein KUTeg_008680, partial [Tegillarca granosa]
MNRCEYFYFTKFMKIIFGFSLVNSCGETYQNWYFLKKSGDMNLKMKRGNPGMCDLYYNAMRKASSVLMVSKNRRISLDNKSLIDHQETKETLLHEQPLILRFDIVFSGSVVVIFVS